MVCIEYITAIYTQKSSFLSLYSVIGIFVGILMRFTGIDNQERFPKHCLQSEHNGLSDWEIKIIDHDKMKKSLR